VSNSCDWRIGLPRVGANSDRRRRARAAERAEQHQWQRRAPLAILRASESPSILGHVHVEDRGVERIACSIQRSASAAISVARDACPTCRLQRENAAIGRVVVDDQQPLAVELAAARRRSSGSRRRRSARRHVDREMNADPLPGPSLSAHMRPPISSARRWLIASPSPVPPYLRVVDESACENDWNSRLMPFGVRPMPVSRTANVSSTDAGRGADVT
jgi:hypothetical protein